ncbi:MAG: hypothetical protein KKE86_15680 [Planctomycetes bacterium]|nr:hypothetical protein [Planctomycetota bacterium]MBU4400757.1 hypothetical protein [Planctomycetota bacterium]MCG2684113.1 hypothetical protein [Planctomycetales bacterium]
MKVNCLSCGHSVDLRDSYDDYQGRIKCFICGAVLAVRTEDGEIKSVEYVSGRPESSESVTRQMQQAAAGTADESVVRY